MTLRAAPKPSRRVISKAVRNSARDKHCTLRLDGCLPGTETVVLAHLRGPWCLSVGAKPSDQFAVYACHHCHQCEEQGLGITDADRLRALYESQGLMIEAGLIVIRGDRP